MDVRTYLLAIALLGFSIVLLPQEVVSITPSTYNLVIRKTNIATCETGSEALTLTNDTRDAESVDMFSVTMSGVGFPALENSDLDGVLDPTANCADTPKAIDGGTWGKGEMGVILLIIIPFILLGL